VLRSSHHLRRLAPGDAALWRDIRREAHGSDPAAFSEAHADLSDRPLEDFAAGLSAMPVWAVVGGGRAIAVAGWSDDAADPARVWLDSVYVSPPVRGRGLARRVISAAEADARAAGKREIWLEVRETNAAARALYARLGYAEAAVPCDPANSAGGLTMRKAL